MPALSTCTDPWRYYLAESLQYFADYWTVDTFLARVFSEGTAKVEVLPETNIAEGLLVLRVYGECFNGPGSFVYAVKSTEFDNDEKYRFLGLIKTSYHRESNAGMPTPRRAAKALGIAYK